MLEFPEESVKQAREIIDKYKKRTRSKLMQAKMLYEGRFLEIGYGFNESIKSGNCGRYLHEIIKDLHRKDTRRSSSYRLNTPGTSTSRN